MKYYDKTATVQFLYLRDEKLFAFLLFLKRIKM